MFYEGTLLFIYVFLFLSLVLFFFLFRDDVISASKKKLTLSRAGQTYDKTEGGLALLEPLVYTTSPKITDRKLLLALGVGGVVGVGIWLYVARSRASTRRHLYQKRRMETETSRASTTSTAVTAAPGFLRTLVNFISGTPPRGTSSHSMSSNSRNAYDTFRGA